MPGRQRSFPVSEMSGRAGVGFMVLMVEGPRPIPFLLLLLLRAVCHLYSKTSGGSLAQAGIRGELF